MKTQQQRHSLIERAARSPKCARCRNHGFVVQLKGHSGKCPFKQCLCWKCSLINERTRILASQRRIRSAQGNESPGTDRPEQTSLSGRKTVSAGDNKSTNRVNGDTDASARKESNVTINTPVDDTTYIELHAPISTRGTVSLSAVHRDPKTPAGPSSPSGTVGGLFMQIQQLCVVQLEKIDAILMCTCAVSPGMTI
uniref:DM domain-containing protein n=1 Tax=Sinocyclocheilus anshuiensis TaxID=1608454 RepID=A0A671K8C9_9TELE